MKLSNDIFFAEVESLLSENRTVEILLRGNSMRPLLRDGRDKAAMCRYDGGNIAIGDIMLFRYRGNHVMHRVIGIDGDRVVFAGDGNYKLVEIVTREDIVARVTTIIRPSGKRIACDSRKWRTWSRLWLMLPREVRRVILGVMRRIKF